jgi:putative component of membrane protein insertase Oxa1/YidC/SpoIIIJ protein YidD
VSAVTPLSLSPVAIRLIALYQRHVSPRKGFRCAYGVRHGRDSCSRFARRAIERCGVVAGMRLVRRRFARCRTASLVAEYDKQRARRSRGERFRACLAGWNPGCTRADAAGCAADGCCELPWMFHG